MFLNKNVSSITNYILTRKTNWDTLEILYNDYINTISFKVKSLHIMNKNAFKKKFDRLAAYDVSEPDSDVSMHYYYEFYVAS